MSSYNQLARSKSEPVVDWVGECISRSEFSPLLFVGFEQDVSSLFLVALEDGMRIVVGMLFVIGLSNVGFGESALERLKTEAPKAWKDYLEFASHLQGTIDEQSVVRHNPEEAEHYVYSIKLDGHLGLFEQKNFRTDYPDFAFGLNSRYEFGVRYVRNRDGQMEWSIEKALQHPDAKGLIDSLKKRTAFDRIGGNHIMGDTKPWSLAMGNACLGLQLSHCWFPKMVSLNSFAWTSASEMEQEGKKLVRAEYTYRPPEDYSRHDIVRNGTVILDPSRYWMILSAKYDCEWLNGEEKGVFDVVNTYSNLDGYPVLASRRETVKGSSLKYKDGFDYDINYTCQLDKTPHSDDESPFRLTAYGLPEPSSSTGSAMGRNSIFLVVLVGAGLAWWAYRGRK